MMFKRALLASFVVTVGGGTLLAGCGGDDDDDGGGNTVAVTLSEWIVEADPLTVAAGEVTFDVSNKGGEVHEFVVVKADSIDSLPTTDTGEVDEEGIDEGAAIGEIEDIAANATQSVTFDLAAGTYVMFCNIYDEDEAESHFAEGMSALLTVTG